jgi:hypothetical protein
LGIDKLERNNLFTPEDKRAESFDRQLSQWKRDAVVGQSQAAPMDPQTLEKLRSLGYVQCDGSFCVFLMPGYIRGGNRASHKTVSGAGYRWAFHDPHRTVRIEMQNLRPSLTVAIPGEDGSR